MPPRRDPSIIQRGGEPAVNEEAETASIAEKRHADGDAAATKAAIPPASKLNAWIGGPEEVRMVAVTGVIVLIVVSLAFCMIYSLIYGKDSFADRVFNVLEKALFLALGFITAKGFSQRRGR